MSKYSEQFQVPLPQQETEVAVKEAIVSCGWGVKEQMPGRIVPRIGIGVIQNPSSIETLIYGDSEATTITLNGRIMGFGPIQKRHITREVGKLRDAINAAVQQAGGG
jgi:hypothetical protein